MTGHASAAANGTITNLGRGIYSATKGLLFTSFTVNRTYDTGASAIATATTVSALGMIAPASPFYLTESYDGIVGGQIRAKAGNNIEVAGIPLNSNLSPGTFGRAIGPSGWTAVYNPADGTVMVTEYGMAPATATADAPVVFTRFADGNDFPISALISDWTAYEPSATLNLGSLNVSLGRAPSGVVLNQSNHALPNDVTVTRLGTGDLAGAGALPIDLRNVTVNAADGPVPPTTAADVNGPGVVTAVDALGSLKNGGRLPTPKASTRDMLFESETFWNSTSGGVGSIRVDRPYPGATLPAWIVTATAAKASIVRLRQS